MDDALKLGGLLKLPDLEEETKALINEKMREFIKGAKPLTAAEAAIQKDELKDVLHEYLNGAQEGG